MPHWRRLPWRWAVQCFELVVRRAHPQAGTPEAVVQTSAEADEDTVQTAARQPETNAAVEPMTAQAVFDPLESEPQTAAQADAAEEMESGGQAGKNYGEAQLVSVSKDSGTEFLNRHA